MAGQGSGEMGSAELKMRARTKMGTVVGLSWANWTVASPMYGDAVWLVRIRIMKMPVEGTGPTT